MLTQQSQTQVLNTAINSRDRLKREMEAAMVRLETIQSSINDMRNVLSTLDYCIELLETLPQVPVSTRANPYTTMEDSHV